MSVTLYVIESFKRADSRPRVGTFTVREAVVRPSSISDLIEALQAEGYVVVGREHIENGGIPNERDRVLVALAMLNQEMYTYECVHCLAAWPGHDHARYVFVSTPITEELWEVIDEEIDIFDTLASREEE